MASSSSQTQRSAAAEADMLTAKQQQSTPRPLDVRHQIHKVQRSLDSKLSKESRARIQSILGEINSLNDVEKLLLYLQLPTGITAHPSPLPTLLSPKTEHTNAATWISSHLEEDPDTCMPKSEIYEDYRMFCERHEMKWMSNGDFNRLLRSIFPKVKARRLGHRGQSRYCFSGIRGRHEMTAPTLPIIDTEPINDEVAQDDEKADKSELDESKVSDDTLDDGPASSDLICQWAKKLFSQQFPTISHLARYLISNNYVSCNSLNAFTVVAADDTGQSSSPPESIENKNQAESALIKESSDTSSAPALSSSAVAPPTSEPYSRLDHHRATQLKLQRKLQERATLNEQKKRLEEQRIQSTSKTSLEEKPQKGTAEGTKVKPDETECRKPAPQKRILPKTTMVTQVGSPGQYKMGLQSAPANVLLLSPSTSAAPNRSGSLVIVSPVNSNSQPNPLLQFQRHQEGLRNLAPLKPRPSSQAVQLIAANSPQSDKNENSQPSPLNATPPIVLMTNVCNGNNKQDSPLLRDVKTPCSESAAAPVSVNQPSLLKTALNQHGKDSSNKSSENSECSVKPSTQAVTTSQSVSCSPATTAVSSAKSTSESPAKSVSSPLCAITASHSEISQKIPGISHTTLASLTKKSKNTPSKPRIAGRTVSDLLKEQRGNSCLGDKRTYVNDRRPVAQLLKESRLGSLKSPQQVAPAGTQPPSSQQPQQQIPFVIQTLSLNSNNNASPVVGCDKALGVLAETVQMQMQQQQLPPSSSVADSTPSVSSPVPIMPASSQEDGCSQLRQMLTRPPGGSNHKLRDLLTEKDDIVTRTSVESVQQLLQMRTTKAGHIGLHKDLRIPATTSNNSVTQSPAVISRGSQRNLRRLHPDLDPKGQSATASVNNLSSGIVSLAPADNENALNLEVQDLCSRNLSVSAKRASSEPPVNFIKRHASDSASVAIMAANHNWNLAPELKSGSSTLDPSGSNQLMDGDQVPSDLADVTPSIPPISDQTMSDSVLSFDNSQSNSLDVNEKQVTALLNSDLDPLLLDSNRSQTGDEFSVSTVQQLLKQQNLQISGSMGDTSMAGQLSDSNAGDHNFLNDGSWVSQELSNASLMQASLPLPDTSSSAADQILYISNDPGPSPASSYQSHRSAASTPMSLLSPKSLQGPNSMDTTASFVPIHSSACETEPLMSPVKPLFTVPQASQQHQALSSQAQMGSMEDRVSQGFLPYFSDGAPVAKAKLDEVAAKAGAQFFAPASSIKPVKRGRGQRGKGKSTTNSKRQRHHSAQDSLLLRSSMAQKPQLDQPILMESSDMQSTSEMNSLMDNLMGSSSGGGGLSVSVNQSMMDVNANAPPESPFSPEIQDIMYGSNVPWLDNASSHVFRSHSVPVQYMLQGTASTENSPGDGTYQTHASNLQPQQPPQGTDTYTNSGEISSLLSDKLQGLREMVSSAPADYDTSLGARRNLTQIMESHTAEEGQPSQQVHQRGLSSVGRGDHLISGAPFRPPLRYAFSAEMRARESYVQALKALHGARHNNPGPTPPSSQNPTPDFSGELTSVHYDVSAGASVSSTAMDTPNSLEAMGDPLLSSMCEESSEASANLTNPQADNFVWE